MINNLVLAAEKGRENIKLFVLENVDKIVIAEVTKMLSAINLSNKYSQAISNTNMNITRNLRLTSIKKY